MKKRIFLPVLIFTLIFSVCANSSVFASGSRKDHHLVLGSIKYEKKIISIVKKRRYKRALSAVMKDVDLYEGDLDNNSPENLLRFHKLVSFLVYKIGDMDIETHYFRNKLNRAPKTLKELLGINKKLPVTQRWRLLSIRSSTYHIQGPDGEYNVKFLSPDGYCEAVYNKKGVLLTEENDPVNMGTYNYAAGIPAKGAHSKFDVVPYLKWGNTLNSPQKCVDLIDKGVQLGLQNYKRHSAEVYIYRKDLFGMQEGRVP